ncbi:pentapeptide repeat-containing protein [Actinomadura madurae]|uniref:pentapeptide repeat-containing protein n=1 Tax=Actinomadura madurae TaxID=1993 RepID=UPI0020276A09|nr:pentapeptide repeat-containing protein [Actinomadura madurae]URM97077.1 pentapeptide repeat-containing protein [Actinomadura madurae]
MSDTDQPPEYRPVKKAHKALGMWSMRRALTIAFSGASAILVAAWFFVSWLLGSPPHAEPKPLDTAAQLDLLKLVFALVAGVGALVALVTAYRRQRVDEAAAERAERAQAHAERVAHDTAFDATERRVTELYGQAVEQLGHDKAAVRLGGLYSLERLAQDHPQHRQTVVDVVCAYLRMPFKLPPPHRETEATAPVPAADAVRQELQVRLAAQRLFHRHLTAPPGEESPITYWDGVLIDLTEAHLINFEFSRCRPARATFKGARFSGDAWFRGVQFSDDAQFSDAQFSAGAFFEEVQFSGGAWFNEVQFSGGAWFDRGQFSSDVSFDGVQFSSDSSFNEVQFSDDARFYEVQFSGDVSFDKAQFSGASCFNRAQFKREVSFDEVRFSGSTRFDDARFSGEAWFDGARFQREPDFASAEASHPNNNHVWPSPWQAVRMASDADMAQLVRQE